MLNENAQKWVQALESGQFHQGRGSLRIGGSYCCLGVACELYRRETGQGEWRVIPGDGTYDFHVNGISEHAILPPIVKNWLGLLESSGGYEKDSDGMLTQQLTADNDGGKSFIDIAEIIVKHENELFKENT